MLDFRDASFSYALCVQYSLASCFAMVSYPAFSVLMLTRSFTASFPFFIFITPASTSHAIIGGTSSWSVYIATAWSL